MKLEERIREVIEAPLENKGYDLVRVNVQGGKKRLVVGIDIDRLDGKNVIFMSASGDDNLACHYGNSTMTECPYDQSYTYTGVKRVCETCPNAKVSFIYQPTKSYQNQIAALYKDLENKYSNFSYDTSAWDYYARKRYELPFISFLYKLEKS